MTEDSETRPVTIEEEIGTMLQAQGLTLATAESCTGGLVGHRLTNVPGSSAYYVGGLVAYSYEAKEWLLGVRHETLMTYGAVSEQTAREMARGARRRLSTGLGVGITGIAGPSGATPDKPVGLVFIALSAPDAELCERHVWQGDRLANKEQSAEAALRLLLTYLKEQSLRQTDVRPDIDRNRRKQTVIINEPLNVEVRIRQDGTVRPVAFVWQGRRFEIRSWGRESEAAVAGRLMHCYLVQTEGPETWELCLDKETAQWALRRHWAGRSRIA